MHLNPHLYLHLVIHLDLRSQCLHVQFFPLRNNSVFICLGHLHLQFFSSFTYIEFRFVLVFCSLSCSGCMDLHLFETDLGALDTYYFRNIACVFWVMGGSLHEIVLPAFTVLMPSLLSISHSFLWENDTKISGFLCVSSVIDFRL